tara:strand:+ start:407 stop:715 length:309 start_codon:yes stop_codon:yes gene_type:complete
MHPEQIRENWESRGYSFGVFEDHPGKVWADIVHSTNELVVLAKGEIEVEIEGKSQKPQIGDEIFIPANAIHTVRKIGVINNVWYYGYKIEFKDTNIFISNLK